MYNSNRAQNDLCATYGKKFGGGPHLFASLAESEAIKKISIKFLI